MRDRPRIAARNSAPPSGLPHRSHTPPQRRDQVPAVGEMLALGGENLHEAALLERQHVGASVRGVAPGGVADDIDQPVERMQAAEQVIVLAVGAREERREVAEADALEALDACEALERARILRADAVDQDLIE